MAQGRLRVGEPADASEREARQLARAILSPSVATARVLHVPESTRGRSGRLSRQEGSTPTEDPGQKRAAAAALLVEELKKAGATYKQEPAGRDWNNYAVSDCSKLVQWVMEGAGQSELFGRAKATTSGMQGVIQELTVTGKCAFRKDDPKVGDIVMWTGHVGIVYEVAMQKNEHYIVIAAMGSSGASLLGKKGNYYWLKVSDHAGIDKLGRGAYLGFWTPP